MNGEWPETPNADAARDLVRKAAMRELVVPRNARVRVWQAVEKKTVTSLKPGFGWRWSATFLAGAACASLVLFFVLRGAGGDPPALVVASDGSAQPLRVGETLPKFTDLSVVDLHAAARVVVGAQTSARLEQLDRRTASLRLDRGTLLLHVQPRPVNAPFLVHTAAFTARVIGTVLRVAVDEQGRASLAVGHGAVELQPTGGGRSVIVHAGERWPTRSTAQPSAAELERLGAEELEGATLAHFAPTPVASAPAPTPLGDENALYDAALAALRAHDPRGALALFRLERARFPHGVLQREVRTSMLDAYLSLGDSHLALRELDAALSDEPHGLRAPELHFLRGTLLRKLDGNCRRARPELDRALEHRRLANNEPWVAAARRARAACSSPSSSR